jgi:Ion channel
MDDVAEPNPFSVRHGWTLRERFLALDSYGLLLLMILLSLVVSALRSSSLDRVLQVVRACALGGTLLFALHTSGASRRAYLICASLIGATVTLAIAIDPSMRLGAAIQALGAFVVIVGVVAVVARRFASHPVVTGSSILAAICIYLFVGLAFATVYGFIAAVDSGPLFGSGTDGTSAIRIYYSFVTLTTLGYGDFVPATDAARMIAVTEALIGQVYLVTVVALLVANVGARRRRPHGDASAS